MAPERPERSRESSPAKPPKTASPAAGRTSAGGPERGPRGRRRRRHGPKASAGRRREVQPRPASSRTGSKLELSFKRALELAALGLVLEVLALVGSLLALGQGQFHLGPAVAEVDLQGHDGQALG